jgi:hypothetical protein
LTVTASDGVNTTDVQVTLNERNLNDNDPAFEGSGDFPGSFADGAYTFTYDENQEVGAVIGRVAASDADGDDVTFAITAGNEAGYFQIDAETGEISLTAAGVAAFTNDFEEAPNTHGLTVTASDGVNTTDVQVTLNERNLNDNDPAFEGSGDFPGSFADGAYTFTYDENQEVGAVIGRVAASDADGDDVTFAITAGNEAGYFQIDAETGEISLTAAGVAAFTNDFEEAPNTHGLTVTASDGVNTTDVQVTLNERNLNDNDPAFEGSGDFPGSFADGAYTFTYDENQEVGAVIGRVAASDADGDDVTFAITAGNEAGYFQIDAETGEISLTEAGVEAFTNDFEEAPNTHGLTVTASDGVNTTDVQVTLNERNLNDNDPAFEGSGDFPGSFADGAYTFTYDENQEVGAVIGRVAASDADGDDVTFAITAGNEAGYFQIDAETGEISLTAAGVAAFTNDFEEAPNTHGLTVTASDGVNTTDVQVTLNERNLNDNDPAFEGSGDFPGSFADGAYTFTYDENQEVGAVIGRVAASDADGDDVTFAITAGNEAGYFQIDAETGEISLTAAGVAAFTNDFEEAPNTHGLTVTASDGVNTTDVQVTLNERNLNDNDPAFEGSGDFPGSFADGAYTFTYDENQEVGAVIGRVAASDADGDDVTFAITAGNEAGYFQIDAETGEISLTAAGVAAFTNDFEEAPNTHGLTVTASDGVNTTDVQVTLNERNLNDNDPAFEGSGDFPGSFADGAYTFTYDENQEVGAVIGRVAASDADGDDVTFAITAGNEAGYFQIDAETGEISLTAAGVAAFTNDFEEAPNTHGLTVTASDGVNTTDVQVTLNERNLNDNDPAFEGSGDFPGSFADGAYTFTYDENQEVGAVIGRVAASDADGDDVTFAITAGNEAGYFQIDAETGEISLTAAGVAAFTNDFEEAPNTHGLTVTASDGVNTTDVQVTLNERNLNDNDPAFEGSGDFPGSFADGAYTFTYDENQEVGAVIGRVAASDADGDDVTFAITAGNEAGYFQIDAETGEISLTAAGVAAFTNDFEEAPNTHGLTVTASDGVNTTDVQVTLNERNLNDNDPAFEGSGDFPGSFADGAYTFTYDENQEVGAVIGRVAASDADGDDVTFAITAGNEAGYFQIDAETGEISLTAAGVAAFTNDFEEAPNTHGLTVTASDGVNTTDVQVTLNERNLNDNDPAFEGSGDFPGSFADGAYTFTYDENQEVGAVIGRVAASDADGDDVTFAITAGNEAGYFQIDAETGEISLTAAGVAAFTNDFEEAPNTHGLTVTASDGVNTTDVQVTLNERNLNDNDPAFEGSGDFPGSFADGAYTFTYDENQEVGAVIGRVAASDADGDDVTFAITAGNEAGYFQIDEETGEISLTEAGVEAFTNDFEEAPNTHVLTVTASDGVNTTDVQVTLNELNDLSDDPLAVTSPTVNEASPHAVFTVTGTPNQLVTLALATGTATFADFGPGLEYFDGSTWVAYTGGLVPVGANGQLLVRTPIVNDDLFEGAETFQLIASNASGLSAAGTATILDDGTGTIFNPDGTENLTAPKDDDRVLAVSSPTVNEASPYAVFTVFGNPNQGVTLALATGTATFADFGPGLEYFNGSTWVAYTGGLVPVGANGQLLVRTPIVNDDLFEGAETFQLIASNASGLSAAGTATIVDDGTGTIFNPDGSENLTAPKDNDSPLLISDIDVNEASEWAVFRVQGLPGMRFMLDLAATGTQPGVNGSGGDADLNTDLGFLAPGIRLQTYNGTDWVDYRIGTDIATFPENSSLLLVRVKLVNDTSYEGPETFQLTALDLANPVGAVAVGTATILDDGRGSIFRINGSEDTSAPRDDDRPLQVDSFLVNEGSTYAIFTINAVAGRVLELNLQDNEGPAERNATPATWQAFPALQYSINGTTWVTYDANSSRPTVPANGVVFVRVDIRSEQDDVYEGAEIFQLAVRDSGGLSSRGTALILDDGTGVKFTGVIGPNGPVTSRENLDDDLDKDGIPPTTEEQLATLVASQGLGNARPGDLNGDGLPDAEQPALATLAWTTVDRFQAALDGSLTEISPIVSLAVVRSEINPETGESVVADDLYQLQDIAVLPPDSPVVGGSKPASLNGAEVIAPWDPIRFTVAPIQGTTMLFDQDPSRPGTQVVVEIDIARAGMTTSDFNAYLKYVSAEAIASAGAGGLRDLDGRPITSAGWYDFTQRRDAAGNFVGDGARFVTEGNLITKIVLTLTDNAFGDSDGRTNIIYDPGMPVWYLPRPQVPPPLPAGPDWQDLTRRGVADFAPSDWLRTPQRFDSTLLGIHGVARLDDLEGDEGLFARAPRSLLPLDELVVAESQGDLAGGWQPHFLPGAGLAVWRGMPDQVVHLDNGEPHPIQVVEDAFVSQEAPAQIELRCDQAHGEALPGWLHFDPVAGRLTVLTAEAPAHTELVLRLHAQDQQGREASTLFRLQTGEHNAGEETGRASLSAQLRLAAQARDLLVTPLTPSA